MKGRLVVPPGPRESKDYPPKTCPTCSQEFKPYSGRHTYCSEKCKRNSPKYTRVFNCEHCGKEKRVSKSIGKDQRFCSHECHYASRLSKIKPVDCMECGVTFMPDKSTSLTHHKRKFCSPHCYAVNRKKEPSPEDTLPFKPFKTGKEDCAHQWVCGPTKYHDDHKPGVSFEVTEGSCAKCGGEARFVHMLNYKQLANAPLSRRPRRSSEPSEASG